MSLPKTHRMPWLLRRRSQIFVTLFLAGLLSAGRTVAETSDLRILSIGSDVTEIVYQLGFGDRMVAVDTTSQYPPEALKENASVGYMRALSPEGVLSVGANLILASEGAGPPEAVRALKASSIRYVAVPEGKSIQGVREKIAVIAAELGAEEAGRQLIQKIMSEFDQLSLKTKNIGQKKRVLFVLNSTGDRMIVGGSNSSADEILKLSGATNAAQDIEGFKPITPESLIGMAPDAIIVMQGGRGGHDVGSLKSIPALKLTPAGKKGTIKEMGGAYLLGFGPRTPRAASEVYNWLYASAATAKR